MIESINLDSVNRNKIPISLFALSSVAVIAILVLRKSNIAIPKYTFFALGSTVPISLTASFLFLTKNKNEAVEKKPKKFNACTSEEIEKKALSLFKLAKEPPSSQDYRKIVKKSTKRPVYCNEINRYLDLNVKRKFLKPLFQDNNIVPKDLGELCSSDQVQSIDLEVEDVDIYTRVPNINRMQEVAEHYQLKYGIEIEIVHFSRLDQKIKDFAGCGVKKNKGFIIYNELRFNELDHVVPLVLNKKNKSKEIEFLNLDVLGDDSYTYTNYCVKDFLKNMRPLRGRGCFSNHWNIVRLGTLGARQADRFSCRTGALVLLRDVLIDLQRHPEVSLCDMTSAEYCDDGYYNASDLPDHWVYSEQIFKKRECYSEIPRKPGVKTDVFRAKYRLKVDQEVLACIYLDSKISDEEIKKWNSYNPNALKVEKTRCEKGLKIELKSEQTRNNYLLLKGLRFAKVI